MPLNFTGLPNGIAISSCKYEMTGNVRGKMINESFSKSVCAADCGSISYKKTFYIGRAS